MTGEYARARIGMGDMSVTGLTRLRRCGGSTHLAMTGTAARGEASRLHTKPPAAMAPRRSTPRRVRRWSSRRTRGHGPRDAGAGGSRPVARRADHGGRRPARDGAPGPALARSGDREAPDLRPPDPARPWRGAGGVDQPSGRGPAPHVDGGRAQRRADVHDRTAGLSVEDLSFSDEIQKVDSPTDEAIHAGYVLYRETHYHQVAEIPKRLCMDEYHLTSAVETIAKQVKSNARDGRKRGPELILVSQLLADFGPLAEGAQRSSLFGKAPHALAPWRRCHPRQCGDGRKSAGQGRGPGRSEMRRQRSSQKSHWIGRLAAESCHWHGTIGPGRPQHAGFVTSSLGGLRPLRRRTR